MSMRRITMLILAWFPDEKTMRTALKALEHSIRVIQAGTTNLITPKVTGADKPGMTYVLCEGDPGTSTQFVRQGASGVMTVVTEANETS